MKLALARLFAHRSEAPEARIIACVHDEIVAECPQESARADGSMATASHECGHDRDRRGYCSCRSRNHHRAGLGGNSANRGGRLMPRRRSVCDHARPGAIDTALVSREAYRNTARRFATSPNVMWRHKSEHLPSSASEESQTTKKQKTVMLVLKMLMLETLRTLALPLHRMPGLHDVLGNPQGQTSPLHQRSVILPPVAETILCLGLLVLHTSRIPTIRLRDYFCNKASPFPRKLSQQSKHPAPPSDHRPSARSQPDVPKRAALPYA